MKPTIADYWRDAAVDWDESSYEKRLGGLSLLERFATLQRAHIRDRYATAEREFAEWIAGRPFVEIGMGGGELLVRLLELGATQGTGIDVSPHAVYRRLKRLPYYKKYGAAEIVGMLDANGYPNARVLRDGSNSFVTTLNVPR